MSHIPFLLIQLGDFAVFSGSVVSHLFLPVSAVMDGVRGECCSQLSFVSADLPNWIPWWRPHQTHRLPLGEQQDLTNFFFTPVCQGDMYQTHLDWFQCREVWVSLHASFSAPSGTYPTFQIQTKSVFLHSRLKSLSCSFRVVNLFVHQGHTCLISLTKYHVDNSVKCQMVVFLLS